MKDLIEKLKNMYRILYLIKDNLRGFKIFFDVENKIIVVIVLGVILSGVGFLGCFLINFIVLNFRVLIGIIIVVILSGIFFFGLVVFDIVDGFEVFWEKVFSVRINVCIKKVIEIILRGEYFENIKKIIRVFL